MIFRPLEPKRYFFFFKWQGMFIRRKKEVSAEFSKLVATPEDSRRRKTLRG
jgi:hypothetical protein